MWSCGSWRLHQLMRSVKTPIGWNFVSTALQIDLTWHPVLVRLRHHGFWWVGCLDLLWSRMPGGAGIIWHVWRALIKLFSYHSLQVFMLTGQRRWKPRSRRRLDLGSLRSQWNPTRTTCTWSVKAHCSGKSKRSSRRRLWRFKLMTSPKRGLRQFCHPLLVALLFSLPMPSHQTWRLWLVRIRLSRWCIHTRVWRWLQQMSQWRSQVFHQHRD